MATVNTHSSLKPDGAQSLNTARDHSFTADEPKQFHGTDEGPTPVEYLLSSIGACLIVSAKSVARHTKDMELQKFEVDVTGETQGFPDKSSKIVSALIKIDCDTNLNKPDQQKFIEETIHRCTIHNTLENAFEMTIEIE
ncbi:OsmC family protein [Lentilactobacillus sp. Marseille-Q4993]|uniref:OsmC family protein n=1 Tax=Lentilactobacillus sp. Marseille-Q4993 TaxID=3039492 RepID=UPI0024BD2B49|nr:OsmC family protein [Lentilactobacillus sp. Marseille-Q4993]